MRRSALEVNGIIHPVTIIFEQRNGSRASIGRKGIVIRIPSGIDRDAQSRAILHLRAWAKKRLEEDPDKFKAGPIQMYRDHDVLKVGHEEYSLHIDYKDKGSSSARIVGGDIHLSVSSTLPKEKQSEHVSALLSRIIARKRIEELKARILLLNEKHFGQKVNQIFFKHTTSRWGSCSSQGNINISTRLLFAPEEFLEYVCIHELAHLIERNHSERFWTLVERAIPGYKNQARWLKEHGTTCNFSKPARIGD